MLSVGATVGYSYVFLKHIGVSRTDKSWARVGVLKALHGERYVRVQWADEETPCLVLAERLEIREEGVSSRCQPSASGLEYLRQDQCS
jgi:hypothetical protein